MCSLPGAADGAEAPVGLAAVQPIHQLAHRLRRRRRFTTRPRPTRRPERACMRAFIASILPPGGARGRGGGDRRRRRRARRLPSRRPAPLRAHFDRSGCPESPGRALSPGEDSGLVPAGLRRGRSEDLGEGPSPRPARRRAGGSRDRSETQPRTDASGSAGRDRPRGPLGLPLHARHRPGDARGDRRGRGERDPGARARGRRARGDRRLMRWWSIAAAPTARARALPRAAWAADRPVL